MSQYMISKFKGKYRLLADLDLETNDFPRDENGGIEDAGVYISCQYGNKVYHWGRDILIAYVPSRNRARNIKKEMKKQKIDFFDYDESDEEAMWKFKFADADKVIELLKPKTLGASISPFSTKNLPKTKVEIPIEEIERYKVISKKVPKNDLLLIKRLNDRFMTEILQKSLRKQDKKYDFKGDMKQLKMSRQVKEFIWTKGFWEEYLGFLDNEINKYYNNK